MSRVSAKLVSGSGNACSYVPSQFGTVTEDYCGYAWSTMDPFAWARHAQTRVDGPGFGGRISMNRLLTLDKIPRNKALRFDMELWHWDDTQVSWDATPYLTRRPAILTAPR